MVGTTAPTMNVSMMPMRNLPTIAASIHNGSSPCGSNAVEQTAEEPFADV